MLLIVVVLILHTQYSVNTIDSMSICMKNVGVENPCLYEMAAALTFSIFIACFQTKNKFVHSQIQQQ